MTSSHDPMTSSKDLPTSPGDYLRQARLAASLNIEDVAKYLHLRHNIIEAIENDDYHTLPASVFIKGYLRAYAKLLTLSGDIVISAFEQLAWERPQTSQAIIGAHPILPEPFTQSRWYPWVKGSIAACLFIAFLAWQHTTWSTWITRIPSHHFLPHHQHTSDR